MQKMMIEYQIANVVKYLVFIKTNKNWLTSNLTFCSNMVDKNSNLISFKKIT